MLQTCPRNTKRVVDDLPLLHRLAIVYLMAPVLVWLVGWFEWWFGLPAALLLGLALAPALCGSWRFPKPSPTALLICGVALAWTMSTAHGGLFDGNNISDWQDRRAMLLEMSRHPWPTLARDPLADYLPWGGGERQALLRYYLAWYMVPGLAGRLFGPAALDWAVPLWTALGAALILLLFARGLSRRRALFAAGAFVFFNGLDPLRILLMRGAEYFQFELDGLGWPGVYIRYFEWDALKGVKPWYTSFFGAFGSATHFLGAALYALLLLQLRRNRRFVAASGVVLAAAPFWSPFVAAGLVPLVVVFICGNAARHRRALASWSNVCLAPALAGLCTLYLFAGATSFGEGWLQELFGWRQLGKWAPRFYFTEFLLLLLLVLAVRPRLARDPLFAAMTTALFALPWYHFGVFNLGLQGSFPSLVVLGWFCTRTLLAGVPGGAPWRRNTRRVAFWGLAGALAIGALGPLMQLAASIRDDVTFRYAWAGLTMFGLEPWVQRQDLAAEYPPLLGGVLRKHDRHAPGPLGDPILRVGGFNVHVRDKSLIFVAERCGPEERDLRVRFSPANPDTNAETEGRAFLRRYGPACGAVVGLPGWPVHGARFGEAPSDGDGWAVEVLFDEARRFAGLSHPPGCAFAWGEAGRACPRNLGAAALREAYQRTRTAAPVARSHFDVFVDDEWIIHVREPCVLSDIGPRFWLHLVPRDPSDLPRKTAAFDNRDFTFGERGALFDGKCVAAWRLPYPVREVRTGQFTAAEEIWRASHRRLEPAK